MKLSTIIKLDSIAMTKERREELIKLIKANNITVGELKMLVSELEFDAVKSVLECPKPTQNGGWKFWE